ncbi:MAG: ABC transporter ATP-binding protein [Candidatus Nanoarchaeia archaeon]
MTNNFSIVLKYVMKSKKEFFTAVFLLILSSAFTLSIPLISKTVINEITKNNLDFSKLLLWFVIAIACASLGSFFEGISRYFTSSAGTKAQYYIRKDLYESINNQSFGFFDNKEIGDLVSRTTSDIENANQVFTRGVITFISAIITLIGVMIGAMLTINSSIYVLLISLFVYFLIIFFSYNKLSKPFISSRENFGKLTTIIRENLIGASVVRIFNSEKRELDKFNKKNEAFKKDTVEAIKWQSIMVYSTRILVNILIVFSLIYGGYKVISNESDIGTLLAFIAYMAMLAMPLNNLSQFIIDFVQSGASLKRVNEIIQTAADIKDSSNAKSHAIKGDVEFKNVNFGYMKESLVLKNINFKALAGQTIAVIGTTGSGKTSLINLVPRYYDATKGAILIDNINVKNYNISNLRSQIGFCSQEVFLFNISIADNIRFGKPDASLDEVIGAAKHANIHDFIVTLPESYETIVGERGSSLSGGQKQRISIARALILNPKILILDDSTSAVDTETEYKIQKALEYLMINRTSFVITQRVSNLKNANKIILMDKGEIIGLGNHEELYNKNMIYTNIYNTLHQKQKEAELELKKGVDK